MDKNAIEALEHKYMECKNIKDDNYSTIDSSRERNIYQRDYARIMYSSSFRRLQGKMQLLNIHNTKFYRNRLTHSLEVSQISRGIVHHLREQYSKKIYCSDDICVVEAASLAHDLGNPPFGHSGERVLNSISKDFGGFEGNAQTLRILRSLEVKKANEKGLCLSNRTLLSVVKYPFHRCENEEKFLYNEEYKFIKELHEKNKISETTLDAQIMDLADEIAYAAHDLEDSLKLKLFTPEDIIYEFKKEKENPQLLSKFEQTIIEDAIIKLKNIYIESKKEAMKNNNHSSEFYTTLIIKEITSRLVNELIHDITFDIEKNKLFFSKLSALSSGLKKITFRCIKRSNSVLIYEQKGNKIIQGLFDAYSKPSFNYKNCLLPMEYQLSIDGVDSRRSIIDYISGMMDLFAIEIYEEIYGINSSNKLL